MSRKKTYEYQGVELGSRVISWGGDIFYEPAISEVQTSDLIDSLSPNDRIHLRSRAHTIYMHLTLIGEDPEGYITDDDLMIRTADLGAKNLTTLYRKDKATWRRVRERGLVGKLFGEEV